MPLDVRLPKRPKDFKINENGNGNGNGRLIKRVTFFGDSAIPEGDPIYESVYEAAKLLAQNDYIIVNGGGPGLMKAATDGAESVNGKTSAVFWEPKLASFFEGKNISNVTDESTSFSNYMMRTLGLIEQGDAYIVCKGGTGTISEFGMVWALAKLYYGSHKPVILYGDFWDDLIIAFQKTMYIDEVELSVLYNARTPEEILSLLKIHELKLKNVKSRVSGDEAGFVLSTEAKITSESYDKYARHYHADRAGKLVAQDQLDEFISLVNPPAKVLDVGLCTGQDASYLSNHYSVTAIEPSAKFCEIAKFECSNVNIVQGDIVNYELEPNTYKGIWARDSIHHISEKNLDKVFQKLSNALVDNGILYIIVREGSGEFVEEEEKNYTTKDQPLKRFYHLFTAEELVQRAEKAGLVLEKIDHTKRSHKWLVGIFRKKA
ncbi:MAG: hypothetical protein KatS3mg085_120 [Candidatus Dojkabacteria bacterium]|nr:MAG: hypothetical protein KatS3mg085_120 [Candidatus Dojkabacteria bacterium]